MDTSQFTITTLKTVVLRSATIATALTPLLFSTAAEALAPPQGYERLALHSPHAVHSGVFERESVAFVYDHYANVLPLGTPNSDDFHVEEKRLIDIEVHVSGGAQPNMTLSGVWIENDGYYKRESWLTLGLSSSDLIDWPAKREFIPIDIEKYYMNTGQMSYAVIWQRNWHEVDWEVKLEVEPDEIFRKIDEGYRVLEFDQVRQHYVHPPFNSRQYFDAILVENSGDNYLNSEWRTINANPLDIVSLNTEPTIDPEVFVTWPPPWAPDFTQAPNTYAIKYGGFNVFDDEKIVDVEFVEFTFTDSVFPETWALVISHPVPDCRTKITEGVLTFADGFVGYDAEHDVGRVIDYEGTTPFQNKPTAQPSHWGHNGLFYGPPGFGPSPTYIHGCKRKLVVD